MKKVFALCVVLFTLLFTVSNAAAQDDKSKPISVGVANGKTIKMPAPAYPAAARAVKAGGAVNVEVLIDEEGNVVSAEAVSGHPLLRQASEKAAMQATFKPFVLSGQAVKARGILVYNFVADASSSAKTEQKSSADDDDEKGEILNGRALKLPSPEYPAAAKAVNAGGAVKIQVAVDEKGSVIIAKAISGHPLLRMAAEEAAMKAEFEPTLVNGKPAKIIGVIVYNFVASGKKQN